MAFALAAGVIAPMNGEALKMTGQRPGAILYDAAAQKLYGFGWTANNFVAVDELDLNSGGVVREMPITASDIGVAPTHMALDGHGGMWITVDCAQRPLAKLVHLDLNAGKVTEEVPWEVTVFQGLDVSPADPEVVAVCLYNRFYWGTVIVDHGQGLPRGDPSHYITMLFSSEFVLYGGNPLPNHTVGIAKFGLAEDGLVADKPVATGLLFENPVRYQGKFYLASGNVLDPASDTVSSKYAVGFQSGWVAINGGENAAYFVGFDGTNWGLKRFDLASGNLTALGQLPGNAVGNLIALGPGKVACLIDGQLVFIDASLFALGPALEFSWEVHELNDVLVYSFKVQNNGGDSGVGVNLDYSVLSGDTIADTSATGGTVTRRDTFATSASLGTIAPGTSKTLSVTVVPTHAANMLSRIHFTSTDKTNPQDVTKDLNVPVTFDQTPPVSALTLASRDFAFDSLSGRMFILGNGNDQNDLLYVLDPATDRMEPPIQLGRGQQHIVTGAQGGTTYAVLSDGSSTTVKVVNTQSRALGPSFSLTSGAIIDLAVSPSDPSVLAVADASAISLYKAGTRLSKTAAPTGVIGFSDDGARLFVRSAGCDLTVYSVTSSGLEAAGSLPDAACRSFHLASGMIFSDAGTIYDIAQQRIVGTVGGLSGPSFLAPYGEDVGVLSNADNNWSIRQLKSRTLEPADTTIPLGVLNTAPHTFIAWNVPQARGFAFRTTSGFYLVNLAPAGLHLFSSATADGKFLLRFNSTVGQKYRIEQTTAVGAQWNVLEDNVAGTDSALEYSFAIEKARNAFYRVVVLP